MATPQITASVASTLNQQELDATRANSAILGTAAQITVGPGQFVFFAAFDGTNNNKDYVPLSGAPQQTNVAQPLRP